MRDFRLGSDSYCLGVIFRADTGSLWHATEHVGMGGGVYVACPALACKERQTRRSKLGSVNFVDPEEVRPKTPVRLSNKNAGKHMKLQLD